MRVFNLAASQRITHWGRWLSFILIWWLGQLDSQHLRAVAQIANSLTQLVIRAILYLREAVQLQAIQWVISTLRRVLPTAIQVVRRFAGIAVWIPVRR